MGDAGKACCVPTRLNVVMTDRLTITPQDRVLLIMNDNRIEGATRLQKYGFLLHEQYKQEMEKIKESHGVKFYSDWKAHYYGPYSKELEEDVESCTKDGIIRTSTMRTDTNKKMHVYTLTIKGRARWHDLNSQLALKKFDEKIRNLQKIPFYTLLRKIYNAYPEFAVESRIKDSL